MTNRNVQKLFSVVLSLCLLLAMGMPALAEEQTAANEQTAAVEQTAAAAPQASTAEFEALYPLMDLVAAASMYSVNAPESVPGADGMLTVAFTDAFFKVGQTMGANVGVTQEMLTSTDAQAALLSQIFAAQLPQLEPVVVTEGVNSFIGFHPVTVNNAAAEGGVQIVGELYQASKSVATMTEDELATVLWLEPAVFTFQSDATALNGFRLTGYSAGTDLDVEEAMQGYFEEIVVEYVNADLGFTLLYPAVFEDESLVEDADGVSATLPDESVSFFAKRVDNVNGASLTDYVSIIANGITDSVSSVNEELQCGSVSYTTDEGYAVFDVFILTDKYIYQAELSYLKSLAAEYGMYTTYLGNSFAVMELSAG